jgi:hypothetical protein
MMAGRAAGDMAGRPEDRSLNTYVLAKTYNLMAVTGLGYLAFTWSTVVLLGGFVTALQRKDFWIITIISMIQAARSVIHAHSHSATCVLTQLPLSH